MTSKQAQTVALVQALLQNARNLVSDARLLFENDRYARAYALAALAGEELAKAGITLDTLLGESDVNDREFRRNWSDHKEKLAGLSAYRLAFLDDLEGLRVEELSREVETTAGRKMDAMYVDLRNGQLITPESLSMSEARDLLDRVEGAIEHAGVFLGKLTPEVADSIVLAAPQIIEALTTQVAGMSVQDAIAHVRPLLAQMSDGEDSLSNEEAAALLSSLGLSH